jgi:uncharacterized protein
LTFKKDFSNRSHFPGTTGNRFDLVLHAAEIMNRIPALGIGLLLLAIAAVPTWGNIPMALALWVFFMVDWLLLASLPKMRKSFGPSRPTLLMLAILRAIFALLPFPFSLVFQISGTLLVIYGFWLEPHIIHVTRRVITSPGFKSNIPLRILHLGDLHIEHITSREIRLNMLIKEVEPDIIMFSGDILNLSFRHDHQSWQDARFVMAEWQAPLGVFIVSGSPAVDLEEIMPSLLKGLPLRWLRNEKVNFDFHGQAIELVGLECTHRPHIDEKFLSLHSGSRGSGYSILLHHSPDLAPSASEAGFHLQLSGHTHGGQVRLPIIGALYTASLYGRRFVSGLYHIGGLSLNITRGIGMEGAGAPRVRFLCPPEITLLEIKSA